MFTGLIRDLGTVEEVQHRGRSSRLRLSAHALDLSDLELGESIAVNGACLTAVSHSGQTFAVDVSPESLDKTTLGRLKRGDRVHLERALRLADRLGGHLVLGHVDGVGHLRRRRAEANAWHLAFDAPPEVTLYLVPKGCVAVDGVSLTVNRCDGASFEVTIVPHTADKTLLTELREGSPVNLEADVLGKYVAGLLGGLTGDAPPGGAGERLRALLATAGLAPSGWGGGERQ
jgi:riboflavin synthase